MTGLFIGLTSIDLIYPFDHFPIENTKNKSSSRIIDIGGPATNAAFAFTALGGKATLVSLIGQQPFAAFMKGKLREYDIQHIDLNSQSTQQPEMASILLNTKNGSRTVFTEKPKRVYQVNTPPINLANFDVICIDGFFGAYVLQLLKKNKTNTPVVFDGGSYKEQTDSLLDLVDYPIFSEHFSAPKHSSLKAYLKEKQIQPFAITKGEKAIELVEKGLNYQIEVPKTNAIDTLGAGDIFHGAFAKYIIQEKHDFKSALENAATIASLSCQFIGARQWVDLLGDY